MTRTGLHRLILAALLLSACGREDPVRPNVILIVMDTARADRCSITGGERATTPELERLARRGTVFTNAWAPSSWTAPSHASLFTGLRPEHHGLLIGVRPYLDEQVFTLAEALAELGYDTACLTGNSYVTPQVGLTQGFDRYEVFDEEKDPTRPAADRAFDRALEVLRGSRSAGRPSFLFLNAFEPHLNYNPPESVARGFYREAYEPGVVERARQFRDSLSVRFDRTYRMFTPDQWSLLSDLYDGEIAALDSMIGRFANALREEGVLDDSVFIVTSDHGENIGEHGLCSHYASLHRTLLHVPLLVRYPPQVEEAARVDEVVRLEDVFPTILKLCGREPPRGLDGLSLLERGRPRLARAALGVGLRPGLFGNYPEFHRSGLWRPLDSVFDGRHHLIRRNDGLEEVFDVSEDPGETRNLVRELPEQKLEELRKLLPRR